MHRCGRVALHRRHLRGQRIPLCLQRGHSVGGGARLGLSRGEGGGGCLRLCRRRCAGGVNFGQLGLRFGQLPGDLGMVCADIAFGQRQVGLDRFKVIGARGLGGKACHQIRPFGLKRGVIRLCGQKLRRCLLGRRLGLGRCGRGCGLRLGKCCLGGGAGGGQIGHLPRQIGHLRRRLVPRCRHGRKGLRGGLCLGLPIGTRLLQSGLRLRLCGLGRVQRAGQTLRLCLRAGERLLHARQFGHGLVPRGGQVRHLVRGRQQRGIAAVQLFRKPGRFGLGRVQIGREIRDRGGQRIGAVGQVSDGHRLIGQLPLLGGDGFGADVQFHLRGGRVGGGLVGFGEQGPALILEFCRQAGQFVQRRIPFL